MSQYQPTEQAATTTQEQPIATQEQYPTTTSPFDAFKSSPPSDQA
jgi:hypothetical protein